MREQSVYPGRAGMVPSSKSEARSTAQLIACLYFGFILTGIGTTLLGCILPALSGIWSLNDSHSGFLIAAQFAGSSCGALLVRSRLHTSLIQGYLLLTASGVSIAFCHGYFAAPLLFCFGLGLGSAMTSTSMIIGRLYNATRGASLSLLNAFWGLGAVLCPSLVTAWEHFYASPLLYLGMAVTATLTLILLGLQQVHLTQLNDDSGPSYSLRARISLLVPLGLFAFLYVGVETSISSWMMTYIHRLPLSSAIYAPIATSFFWIALVCGRAAAPAVLRKLTESRFLTISLSVLLVSNVMLLLSYTSVMSLTSAALAGLMLAPIFPLCLSKVLAITNKPSESRWIFAISGLGGAVLPWMTGQLATARGSLRTGLIVPLLASAVMLFLHLRTNSLPERSKI
jgi:MFS transporter, FHS family, glucose/mannose:H+ symporter